VLTESQVAALERKKHDDEACGEIETEHPGYLGSQDTFYVGTLKGVGRIYQQTFVDTYSKVAFAAVHGQDRHHRGRHAQRPRPSCLRGAGRSGLAHADRPGLGVLREARRAPLPALPGHKTKVKSPQTNGICERFHKTILQEFYQITFRKKLYESLEQLQADLDAWMRYYNEDRTHQGKMCCGRTPAATFADGMTVWREKQLGTTAA